MWNIGFTTGLGRRIRPARNPCSWSTSLSDQVVALVAPDLVGLIRIWGRNRGRLVGKNDLRRIVLRVLLLLLLALQFLQKLFGSFRGLLGRILILLVGLIGCGRGSRLIVGDVAVFGAIIGVDRSRNGLVREALRTRAAIGDRRRGVGRTGLRRQEDALNGGGIAGGTHNYVVEVGAVEEFGQNVTSTTGADVGDHALGGVRRNLEFGASFLLDRLEHVGEGGVMCLDRQLATVVADFRSNGGNLIEGQRLQWSRRVGRNWRRGRLLLFEGLTHAALLGKRAWKTQGCGHQN